MKATNGRALFVTGPAGSGKSAVGRRVAERFDARFVDADDLHSAAARARMGRGEPLDASWRRPWLERVAACAAEAARSGEALVIAVSGLAVADRELLLRAAPGGLVVGLRASESVLRERVAGRSGHFFPVELVASQLAALEPAAAREALVAIDAEAPLAEVVDAVAAAWRAHVSSPCSSDRSATPGGGSSTRYDSA